MKIKYLGHSCFKMTDSRGVVIITDPFDESVGYKMPNEKADIVTVSHGHFDHNYFKAVSGDFKVIDKVGNFYVKDINIKGIASYHDKEHGAKRGSNTVYTYEIDGVKLCHMGDLGHIPDKKMADEIGGVDILLIPVGGYFTIDADEASKVVELLQPGVVIPMHYKTPEVDFPIETVDKFLEKLRAIEKIHSTEIDFNRDNVKGKGRVCLLKYK